MILRIIGGYCDVSLNDLYNRVEYICHFVLHNIKYYGPKHFIAKTPKKKNLRKSPVIIWV